MTLIVVRAISITSSIASRSATPASPGKPKLPQVPAMITNVARGTPATPFNHQRQRRNALEVEDRPRTHPTYGFEITSLCNSNDDG